MTVFLTSKYKILLQLHILYTHHTTVIDSNAKKIDAIQYSEYIIWL